MNKLVDGGGIGRELGMETGKLEIRTVQKKGPGFRLTDRDYEIFGFLLDQKFASLEALYFRFFDGRKGIEEPLPENFSVVRQRMGILKRAGLVSMERVFSDPKSLFLLTNMGYRVYKTRAGEEAYANPPTSVDFRSYEHDTAVTYCRVTIERMGKSIKWYSDRRLRMQGFQVEGIKDRLPVGVVPDGIFINSKGERVAFELEFTNRKKDRYQNKINRYRRVMFGEAPLLHKVLFVAGNERVYGDLKSVIREDRYILLESYQHFLGKLFPTRNIADVYRPNAGRVEEFYYDA